MWAINVSGALAFPSTPSKFPNVSPKLALPLRKSNVQHVKCGETLTLRLGLGLVNQFVHVVTLQPIEFEAEEETCNVFKLLSEIEITFYHRVEVVSGQGEQQVKPELRTCRTCKKAYSPLENHPRACRYHSAHFGGETKRKFESVYTGGTLTTVGGGEIIEYWHCCGVKDPFDPGCEAAPHISYDD